MNFSFSRGRYRFPVGDNTCCKQMVESNWFLIFDVFASKCEIAWYWTYRKDRAPLVLYAAIYSVAKSAEGKREEQTCDVVPFDFWPHMPNEVYTIDLDLVTLIYSAFLKAARLNGLRKAFKLTAIPPLMAMCCSNGIIPGKPLNSCPALGKPWAGSFVNSIVNISRYLL